MKLGIKGMGSISPLGCTDKEVWKAYLREQSFLSKSKHGIHEDFMGKLHGASERAVETLKSEHKNYQYLDKTTLLAMYAAKQAFEQSDWEEHELFGVNIGSSRGAAETYENLHEEFLQGNKEKVRTLTSPLTTLGNVAFWTAHHVGGGNPALSHSITCSSAFHALLNAHVWIKAGEVDKFIFGGAEAPLTPFFIEQMKALRVYTREEGDFPTRALDLDKNNNSMALGEGAAAFCVEKWNPSTNYLAVIQGIGYATEPIQHHTSVSKDGLALKLAMEMAIGNTSLRDIDAIVMHAPGTIKGDASEMEAVKQLFGAKSPHLLSNKWKIGHTLGSSGALSLELAIMMLQHQMLIDIPYLNKKNRACDLSQILVNATGFGGNAVSVLISM